MIADGLWNDIDHLNSPFVGLGLIRPYFQRENGRHDLYRSGENFVIAAAATKALKLTIRDRDPLGSLEGTPSGHTSMAFAVATFNASLFPREAPFWYGGATVLAIARSEVGAHYTHQLLLGAALGYGIARWTAGAPNGVFIAPLLAGDARGAQLTIRF